MQHPKIKKQLSKILVLFSAVSLLGCDAGFPDLRAIQSNNRTAKKMKDQSTEESQLGYLEAMKYEPFQEEIHLNLGSTYDVLKDPEKALRLYKNAEEIYSKKKAPFESKYLSFLNPQHPLMLLFISYFNQAQLLARENKIDQALEKYQQALSIVPDSKEVKTNIELLLQQKQQQQGGGEGQGDNKDQQDQKDQKQKDGKDNKDQNKDQKDGDDEKKQDQKKNYNSSPKYKPREFKGDLNKESVQKIFGEVSQQEKKMRTQFSKQNQSKESPRDKDW
jgi:tetratricopeptide (TPR) repeat protein